MASRFQALIILTLVSGGSALLHAQQPALITGGNFMPGYQALIESHTILAREGGAAVVEKDGKQFFIAVGVTVVQDDSASERLRQLRVGKLYALKAVAEFIMPVKVDTQTQLTEKTTVVITEKGKSGKSFKELDETTRTSVETVLKAPEQVGSWKSADGKLFFVALGQQL